MNDYDATRRRRADYGLDWRFEWQRYVSRRLGGKATVLAVAGALAARASNADGTAYLSSETMAAEIGKAENHTKDARAILVDAGFLIDTGRTRSGCKVWHLAFPAVHLDDAKAVAAEKRLHRRRTDLAGDPNLGSVHSGDPDLGTEQGPESRNTGTRISEHGDPDLGSHTGDGTGKGTGDDVDRRARERSDASGPLGAAYGDAPLEPRTSDEGGDPIGAAVIGYGAADDHPQAPTTTAPGGADEETDVIDFTCETHGVELPCRDCDDLDTQADLAAGRPSTAEHDASHAAGGHDTGSPRAEDLILGAARKAAPGAITDSEAGRAMRDSGDPRGYLGVLGSLVLAGQLHRRVSYPHDGGSLLEYWVPGGEEPPLRPMHHSARPRRPEADETDTAGVGSRGRGYAPSPTVSDRAMDFLGSFGRDTGPADDDLDDDCDDLDDLDDLDDDPWSSF